MGLDCYTSQVKKTSKRIERPKFSKKRRQTCSSKVESRAEERVDYFEKEDLKYNLDTTIKVVNRYKYREPTPIS